MKRRGTEFMEVGVGVSWGVWNEGLCKPVEHEGSLIGILYTNKYSTILYYYLLVKI